MKFKQFDTNLLVFGILHFEHAACRSDCKCIYLFTLQKLWYLSQEYLCIYPLKWLSVRHINMGLSYLL